MTAPRNVHNELLGGHGSDTIYAGPVGDVLWGDYKPSGQSTTQHDVLIGGAGNDHFYASHGYNRIQAGGGDDWVKAHFGRGIIDCGARHRRASTSRAAPSATSRSVGARPSRTPHLATDSPAP